MVITNTSYIVPVNKDHHLKYCEELSKRLNSEGIRVKIDGSDEWLNYKIRQSNLNKIPYTLIIGDNEKNSNKISYRLFGSNDTVTIEFEQFI